MSLPKDWKNRPIRELPWWVTASVIVGVLWCMCAAIVTIAAIAKQFPNEVRPVVIMLMVPVAFWRVVRWWE